MDGGHIFPFYIAGLFVRLHVRRYASLVRIMDGRIMRYGIISSCQPAVMHLIGKRFWMRAWHLYRPTIILGYLPHGHCILSYEITNKLPAINE